MAQLSGANRNQTLHTVVVLALCAVFSLLAMGMTLMGASLYQNTAAAADDNFAHRTSLSFLVNQLRRNDCGKIAVGDFDGQRALLLFESEDDPYATVLYCYEGQLMELYAEATYLDEFHPADGTPIMELGNLTLTVDGALLTIVADGQLVTISPRCGLEEVGAL